jgi:hypothetical protein
VTRGEPPPDFSVAVFPFLKTSEAVRIGAFTFRSTDDVAGLPELQAQAVREIAAMLFAKDDYRVASASYAIVPRIDIDLPDGSLDRLVEIRTVVAYLYSSPHDTFDSLFLTPEDCSLHVLSPDRVIEFLVRPVHHTERVNDSPPQNAADDRHELPGYTGLFNLHRAFWVEAGSRIYPPLPQITLNISQDLAHNLHSPYGAGENAARLLQLLRQPRAGIARRIFTALEWYNFANERGAGADRALLNLAVAFEALLMLPKDSKSDRLVDTISLLLGRTERLDEWARQFYRARSRVAHEGRASETRFKPNQLGKRQQAGAASSLMFYGRSIFQSCVLTLLTGGELAEHAGLREKFETHEERFKAICATLNNGELTPPERLAFIEPMVAALRRFQFLNTGPTTTGPMLGAVRAASRTLLAIDDGLDTLREPLERCARPAEQLSEMEAIGAVIELHDALQSAGGDLGHEQRLVEGLVHFVWRATFQRYYYLQRSSPAAPSS